LEIDRKTVRKALRSEWKGYARAERGLDHFFVHPDLDRLIAAMAKAALETLEEGDGRQPWFARLSTDDSVRQHGAPAASGQRRRPASTLIVCARWAPG
jgi:hypothetical protein